MSAYKIERLNIEDYHKCSNIWDMNKCTFTEHFKQQIINGDRQVYIYKLDNAFIGEGALVKNADDADYYIEGQRIYLSRMLVKKEYRNRGIGTEILHFLIAKAKELGYKEIALGVDTDNLAAIHLYSKMGFIQLKACKDEYGEFYKLLKEL